MCAATNSEVVDQHLRLCEDILAILSEENRMLRRQPAEVEDELLAQKRELLPQLDASLAALKTLHEQSPEILPAIQEKLKTAQNKIMRILLLDRENEQLLLKALLPKVGSNPPKRSMESIKGIYEKHRIPGQ
ncbi:MAG: hypothetical protein ABQ298_01655 [Puniceicoccaceae bacterium]